MARATAKTELFAQWQNGALVVADQGQSTGARFWVHAGTGSDTAGYGRAPETPFASLAYAFSSDVCTASKGDIIYLMPGHTEAVSAAGTITLDIAGVKVVGLGEGNVRPKITYSTADTASFLMSGANVTVENVIFDMTGFDGINTPISVTAAGCTIRKCEIEFADAGGQADYAIVTDANANDLVVEDCYMFGSGDAGTAAAIHLVGGDSIKIRRNVMVGAFTNTTGGILSDTTATTNLIVEDNVIDNRTAGSSKAAIFHAGTTGVLRGNSFSILSGIAPVTAAAMVWGGDNVMTNAVATEAAPLATTADGALNYIGVDDANNVASTSNVTANEDGSILERLEQIQEAVNVGTGTSLAANKSLVDALGTDGNAVTDAAVSVLGAIGANNANNAFSSATVAANADGSVLERLEYLQGMPTVEHCVVKSDGTLTNPTDALFTVSGGPVLVTEFLGLVTTVTENTGAVTCQIKHTPTAPGGAVNLSTAVDIANQAEGTAITFTAATPGVLTLTAAGAFDQFVKNYWLLPVGAMTAAFGASKTGAIAWYMVYKPLSPSSVVTAAA